MENHHFQWENPLFQWSFSIAISRYIHILYLYTQQICWPFWSDQNTGLLAVQRRASRIHVRYHMCISKYKVFLFYYILYYTILLLLVLYIKNKNNIYKYYTQIIYIIYTLYNVFI